jgi:cytoskeletal protein CcmA (bactofilin family)
MCLVGCVLFAGAALADEDWGDDNGESKDKFYHGIISDDVFTAGEAVDVDGEVEGDVFAAGGNVAINGRVKDQLIAAGGQVTVSADVAGDLIVAGGRLDLAGMVGDNMVAAGGSITIHNPVAGKLIAAGGQVELARDATVAGPAWITGGQVIIRGVVNGDARINGGLVQIYGDIRGDVDIRADRVSVMPGATIGGGLTVKGPRAPEIAGDASVAGDVRHIEQAGLEGLKEKAAGLVVVAMLLPFLFCIVLGAGLVYATPSWVAQTADTLVSRPLASLGLGFIVMFGVPGVLGALAITVIGLPIAIIGFCAFVILMTLAVPLVLLSTARIALTFKQKTVEPSRGKLLLVFAGLLIALGLVSMVPLVGQFILGATFLLGTGASLIALYMMKRDLPAT